MTKSTFENMFQTIPLVQKGMEIGSSPIPKEQAEHFPGCVSGTLYYAEKQNESQCVAFGVTFPEYYVVAATLQDGGKFPFVKKRKRNCMICCTVYFSAGAYYGTDKHRQQEKASSICGEAFLVPNSMHGYFGDLCFGSAIRSIPYRCSTQICGT